MAMEVASACDAWKKCTLEMVNLITNNSKPSLMKDYNHLLLENIDLKKQNKIAIAALDSAISEKDVCTSKNSNGLHKKVKFYETLEEKKLVTGLDGKLSERDVCDPKNGEAGNTADEFRKQEEFCEIFENIVYEKSSICKESKSVSKRENALRNKKNDSCSKLKNFSNLKITNESYEIISEEAEPRNASSVGNTQTVSDFICNKCCKLQASNDRLLSDIINLKEQLDEANESNRRLTLELNNKTEENDRLSDQIQSLDLAVKTLTEAINLQDEQLSEYGCLVASLRKSRTQIIEKMKEANARNNYNVMIMANIEQEVEQLRRQLDAYNELLINQQTINLIDKASSTEQADIVQDASEELLKKKDNYITMLQDRLCEAIVDLKHKDSEIKNHTNLVKELISNYETEKKCLEERIQNANVSTVKMEENRIKQQETMKQLMKLIEFLQGKLEKINKK